MQISSGKLTGVADVGDFGSAGAFNIRYYDALPSGFARAEGGQYGYGRLVAAVEFFRNSLKNNHDDDKCCERQRKKKVLLSYAQDTPLGNFQQDDKTEPLYRHYE